MWRSAAFLDEVRSWVADALTPLGASLTGEWAQPHCRPWSSAIRFGTTSGPVWFKVNGPGTAYEAGLVVLLAELAPGLGPEVLRGDAGRGWSLSRDAGPLLRVVAPADRLWDRWEALVVRYALAQVSLAGQREALLGAGMREVSPRSAPGLARELRDELAALPPESGGLTVEQAAGIGERLPAFDARCAELEASGVPDSLQHDDLHSANVCWPGTVDDARVIDWGDASFGSPLGSMLATMNSLAFHAGVLPEEGPITDPRVLRVRDAYLEPFTRYADRVTLVRLVDLVRRTGGLTRALSYRAALVGEPVSTHAELDFPVRGWFVDALVT